MSPLLTPTMPPSDPDRPTPLLPEQYPPTLLLRVYGPSSDNLISRSEELRILTVLKTQYGLGPKVYGTFGNGRIEQFFPSRALKPEDLHDSKISRSIARRMRELHSVDLKAMGYQQRSATLWRCLEDWIAPAEEVMAAIGALGGQWELWAEKLALHRLKKEIVAYRSFVGNSEVVFCHNDTQYGNVLRLDNPPQGPDHHNFIVIDFEFAGPNPRGYDIANHFHEWCGNYHHPTHMWSMKCHGNYPELSERENFYRAYLSLSMSSETGQEVINKRKDVEQTMVDGLEAEVRRWSPASNVFWALWGIVQAEGQVIGLTHGEDKILEFDYLLYAMERVDMFRDELTQLGLTSME